MGTYARAHLSASGHILPDPDTAAYAAIATRLRLFKTEVIHARGPWRSLDAVEYATLEWVDWFNSRRLLEPIGYVPPAEFEAEYYRQQSGLAIAA